MGELTHDIVSLAELQFELFRIDCREGLKRMLIPVALLLSAGIVAAGTVPVALIFMAEFLTQVAGLSRAAAFSIAALSGFIVAVAMGVVGWSSLRGVVHVFARSREELTRNMTWIKQALKRPAPDRITATSGSLIFPVTIELRSLTWPHRQKNIPSRNREMRPRCGRLPASNDQERLGAFSGIWARAPRSRGPMVLRHWLRTRLETQAVVSGRADHPERLLGF